MFFILLLIEQISQSRYLSGISFSVDFFLFLHLINHFLLPKIKKTIKKYSKAFNFINNFGFNPTPLNLAIALINKDGIYKNIQRQIVYIKKFLYIFF